MDFSEALNLLKSGEKMTRKGWNGKGMWVAVQWPDEHSANTLPYLYMFIPAGTSAQLGEQGAKDQRVPWIVSQTDIFAEDWAFVQ